MMIYDILGYILLLVVSLNFSLFLFREIQVRRADPLILALKDFIIAIDDAEPEKLSGAYIGAAEALDGYGESR
jgi:hypothetical protein